MPTRRKAQVRIVNETGRDIEGVSINHKYSDVYKHKGFFGGLKSGETSGPFEVEYNTGFLTTGQDWWQVSWLHTGDPSKMYYSDPTNFRGIIDAVEGILPLLIGAIADAAKSDQQGKEWEAALEALKTVGSLLFNTESTKGFKKHFLEAEDEGDKVRIHLLRDNKIRFFSPSGNSDTVASVRSLRK